MGGIPSSEKDEPQRTQRATERKKRKRIDPQMTQINADGKVY
jgi:hypothetical protein